MIIDCFLFFNEMDLLEIRLNELRDVVDMFVLIEANETFSGKPKPLYYDRDKQRYNGFPICHVVIPKYPDEFTNAWERENYTRDYLMKAINDLNCSPNDIVMLSDIDEIPRKETVQSIANELKGVLAGRCYVLKQQLSYYYVNCISDEPWLGTVIARLGDIPASFSELRHAREEQAILLNGGWHFSYLGGADRIREKIEAYSHVEFNTPEFTNTRYINQCINEGRNLFKRDIPMRYKPLDDTFPSYLVQNYDRFDHLIAKDMQCAKNEQPRINRGINIIENMYRAAVVIPSDISEHIPFLRKLGSTVNHITEMGASIGNSTSAFLASCPKRMVSYDIVKSQSIVNLEVACRTAGIDFVFYEKSVLDVEIEETDLLFIDTWHVGQQIQQELKQHASKARKFLVMHDTEAFAHEGETIGGDGIWPPIAQYMREHPEWQLLTHFPYNNGLTVFQRIQD